MTIEEKLLILKEMKERSERNTEHLHGIPDKNNTQNNIYGRSFSENKYNTDCCNSAISLNIKLFLFRCVFCTVILLGLYWVKKQDDAATNKQLNTLSNYLTTDSISFEEKNKLQDIINTKVEALLKEL